MRCLGNLVWTVVLVAVSLASPPRAAAAPLLVVVESAEHGAADPEVVRRSIAAELGTPVLAPAGADPMASDVLVVAVDSSRIRVSLRTSTTAVVTRTIDAPADRAMRVRRIAWLAGNLARDQVGPLVEAEPLPERPVGRGELAAEAPAEPSRSAPVVPPPSAAPPVPATAMTLPALIRPSPGPVEVAVAVPAPAPEGPRWSVTIAGGTAVGTNLRSKLNSDGIYPFEPTYQLEGTRQARPGGLILGAALDMGSSTSNRLAGLAGFAGTSRRYGRWLFETTGGVGVELLTMIVPTYTFAEGRTDVQASSTLRTALYLRGTGSIGFALSSRIDLLVGLIVHVTTAGSSFDFAGGTAGLRYRLP